MFHVRWLALLLVPALAFPAAAQLTEKQAVAQVKSASKAQLKAFKATAAAALGTMDATLKTIEASLNESSTPGVAGAQIASLAIDFATTMDAAQGNSLNLVEAAAVLALQGLANGGDLAGIFPKELYYGGDGVLDDNRHALEKAVVKVRDSAIKRLAKSAALAEKKAGLAISLELRLPVHHHATTVNPSGKVSLGEGVRLDVIAAISDLSAAGDGLLILAGSTADTSTAVTVTFFGPQVSVNDDVTPDGDGRFVAAFASGVPEGGLVVQAQQGVGAFEDTASIGMR